MERIVAIDWTLFFFPHLVKTEGPHLLQCNVSWLHCIQICACLHDCWILVQNISSMNTEGQTRKDHLCLIVATLSAFKLKCRRLSLWHLYCPYLFRYKWESNKKENTQEQQNGFRKANYFTERFLKGTFLYDSLILRVLPLYKAIYRVLSCNLKCNPFSVTSLHSVEWKVNGIVSENQTFWRCRVYILHYWHPFDCLCSLAQM